MSLGNLSIKISADIGQFSTNLDVASKLAQSSMAASALSVDGYRSSMLQAGNDTALSAAKMSSSMQAANDAINNSALAAVNSIQAISATADKADFRPMSEKLAEAIGTGIGGGIVAANKAWDGYVAYTKTKALIIGAAVTAAFAVVGLGAVYTAYKVISGSMGFITGLITGDSYKSANIDALIKANDEVKAIQSSLALTAQQASATNEALKALGVDKSDYLSVYTKAQDAIRDNKDSLAELGLSYGSVQDLMQSANAKLNEYTAGWDRNQAAQQMGLGTAAQVAEAAKMTASAMGDAKSTLDDYNLGIGVESQAAVRQYTDTMREFNHNMDLTSDGFKRAIADNIMPILTDLADFFKDGFPSAVNAFRYTMAQVTSLFYGLKTSVYIVLESIVGSLSAVGSTLVGVVAASAKALSGDFAGAKDELVRGWEKAGNRLGEIGDNIVAQSRNNAAAMRLAWAFDDRSSVGQVAQAGKSFIDPAIAKKIKEQADAYQKMADAITEKTEVQRMEIQLNDKLTEGQRKALDFTRELAKGTSALTDAQKADYSSKLEGLIAQEKINKARDKARSAGTTDNGYDSLIKSIREKIEVQKLEQSTDLSLTDGQKMAAKIMTDLRDGILKLTQAKTIYLGTMLEDFLAQEQLNASHKEALKQSADMLKFSADNLKTLDAQIEAERIRNAEMGLSKQQIEALAASRLLGAAVADEELASNMRAAAMYAGPLHDAYLTYANDLDNAALKKRSLSSLRVDNEGKQGGIDALAEATKAREELDKLFDPAKGRDFGTTIKGALSEAVGAVAKLDVAMRAYGTNQAAIEKSIALAKKEANGDSSVLAARMDMINKKSAENQLANYASITGAAKGFFSESSRSYKALQAAEQIFQAAQLAMTLSATASKLLGIGAVTTATIAGEELKNAAVVGGVGIALASDAIKGASAATVAVATQAQGDPYSAWPRMAAMAAVMAAMGFAVGGFGGGDGGVDASAIATQKKQGTGTVFGDELAKSDSIQKSIELLGKNSDLMLPATMSMASSLQNIASSMSGLANIVFRTAGVTDGSNMGIKTGTISRQSDPLAPGLNMKSGAIIGSIFGPLGTLVGGLAGKLASLWGKTTQDITDGGLQIGGSIGALQHGQGVDQYANIHSTSSTWFGLKKSSSDAIQTQGVSGELSQQFGQIFTNLQSSLMASAGMLGKSSISVGDAVNAYVIDTTKISLQGLKGADLQNAISSVISSAMDNVSKSAFPALDAFRSVGEGYTQTVMRVASGVELAQHELDKFGVSSIKFSDVINKQGDIGGEIMRQSLLASEGISGVGKIINGLTGSATDLSSAYKTLLDIRKQMSNVGMDGQSLGTALIKGAGGNKELADSLSTYQDQYFSDAEKAAAMTGNLSKEFTKLGVVMPGSKLALRTLIEQTGTGSDASAKLSGQLLALTGSFATASDAVEKLKDAQRQSILSAQDSYASFADGLRKFQSSLVLGSSSTLTPMEKYAEAKRQYEATLNAAKGGDKNAQSGYQSIASAFLEASRLVNASSTSYASDFQSVMGNAGQMAGWADQQADLAKASLAALNQQITATGRVEQAIKDIGAQITPAPNRIDYSQYGQENTTALVDEIKQLRAEVKSLRDDQQQQTDQLITSNYDANYGAAKTVADSTVVAAQETIWAQQSQAVIKK